MKKLIVLCSTFALVSTVAFAQFTFSGGTFIGIGGVFVDNDPPLADAPYYQMSSQTHAPYRILLNGDYTSADGNMGVSLGFQGRPGSGNPKYNPTGLVVDVNTGTLFDHGYGWVQLFDKRLKMTGGYNVVDRSIRTGGDIYRLAGAPTGDEDADDTPDTGIVLLYTPFSGLSFRGSVFPGQRLQDATYAFATQYSVPRAFSFGAIFERNTRELTVNSYGREITAVGGSTTATIGASYLGIQQLGLGISIKGDRLHDFSKTGTLIFLEYITWTMGGLKIGIDSEQRLIMSDKIANPNLVATAQPMAWLIQPYISYTKGMITPRLGLVYVNGGDNDATLWTFDSENLTNAKGDWAFIVQPSIAIRPVSGFSINAGIKYAMIDYDATTKANPAYIDRQIFMVYMDFSYRFSASTGGAAASGGGNPNYPGGGGNPNYPGGGGNPAYR
jgi:hypothetical protein